MYPGFRPLILHKGDVRSLIRGGGGDPVHQYDDLDLKVKRTADPNWFAKYFAQTVSF